MPRPPSTASTSGTSLLSSRGLLVAAVLLAGGLLAALAALVAYVRGENLAQAHEQHRLLARVLEDQASRSIEAVAVATATLAEALQRGEAAEGATVNEALRQTLASLSQLRMLAIVAPEGGVLAAAGTAHAGERADLTRLVHSLPAVGQAVLGAHVPGRGLPLVGRGDTQPAGLGVLPYVRAVAAPNGRPLYVVALINPDAFANFQEQASIDATRAAALVAYDGSVVAATRSSGLQPSQNLAHLPPFRQYLPQREQATWVGAGLRPGRRVAAFRSLRQLPLVVIVDMEASQITAATLGRVQYVVLAGLAASLLMLLLGRAASRAQAARERAQQELAQAQAALAARGRELDLVFGSVRELLFQTDAQGVLRLLNPRWEPATGRPLADALGRPLASLVVPESHDEVEALFQGEEQGGLRHAEAVIEGSQGRRGNFDFTVVPLREDGRVVGFAGSAVDVTELVAAQSQLRAQLAFNASLIECNPLPVVVLDTMLRYVRVNRAWEVFTGRSRDTVIGTFAPLVRSPESARIHEQHDRELLAKGGEVHYETQDRRSDGRLRDIRVSKALISDAEGKALGIVGVFMDISEIREADRITRHARDTAEQVSKAKSESVANVSHELRTPLQAILGFAEIGNLRSRDEPRLNAMFVDIHRAGQRMLAMVNEMLDLSRLERRDPGLTPTRQDVRDLVQDVAFEVEPLLQAKDLKLQLATAAQPLMADVDGPRLQQALRNLLANAIRFSPPQGTIEITAEARANSSHGIRLVVADRGPGVPPAQLERIFEAFVRAESTEDDSGGKGLGLAVARRIVAAHGGYVVAQNRAAGGAVFTVTLPAAP